MQFRVRHVLVYSLAVLTLLAACSSRAAAYAGKAKTYLEHGKVIGNGTTGSSANGQTYYTHVYKIETDKAIFSLDCGKRPFFGSTGGECGGDTKIQIGDVLHFRIEKSWAYIPVKESGAVGEQKLRILSQELKPDASNAKADTKPADDKQ